MTLRTRILSPLLGGTLLLAALAAQADAGQTTVATELKSAPNASSATIQQLSAGQSLQIGTRQGAWYQVKTAQGEGWVRMLNVRLQGGATRGGESTMSGLASLAQASRSNTTVATGVRGLSREQLQNAQEDTAEVARLSQYQVSAEEARQFAQAAGLPAPRR
ncbi:MAG: SH3 domain-containing protein [Pseudomonadales bacterium]